MSIEVLTLTDKGTNMSNTRRRPSSDPWINKAYDVVYTIGRAGGRLSSDRIVELFGGDKYQAGKMIGFLKNRNVVTGE